MSCEQMELKLGKLLCGGYFWKSKVYLNNKQVMVVRIDMHGMNRDEAYRTITGILNANKGKFIIDVIHGYNHGTVLKNMIQNDLRHRRITKKENCFYNQGETMIEVCAA